jgi:sugar phosphate isomerase/epimerase
MQLALGGRALGRSVPLEEEIRIAATTGYPWLVVDSGKCEIFLRQPDYDIRDLKRLFLRTQPAALDGLYLPDCEPTHLPHVEALCREARRLGAPVLVTSIEAPDERVAGYAEVAKRWSCVLALSPSRLSPRGATLSTLRQIVQEADHEALGFFVDLLTVWRHGEDLITEDAHRVVLLGVGDVDETGEATLPGQGIVPLVELLKPLYQAGFNGLAVLMMELRTEPPDPEEVAREGQVALRDLLARTGWSLEG